MNFLKLLIKTKDQESGFYFQQKQIGLDIRKGYTDKLFIALLQFFELYPEYAFPIYVHKEPIRYKRVNYNIFGLMFTNVSMDV